MGSNEVNIGLAYRWVKFHSTDDAGKMQKNSTPYKESLQTEILQAGYISRAISKYVKRLICHSGTESSLLTYLPSDEKT